MAFIGVNTTDGTTIPTVSDWSSSTSYVKGDLAYVATGSTKGVWLATQSSSNIAPAANSSIWQPYFNNCWATTDKTLITQYIHTFTHDRFTGSILHVDATSTTAGNLYVQQSGDGIIWDVSTTITTAAIASVDQTTGAGAPITTAYGKDFSVEVLQPYLRLKFVYGTNKPSTFRLFGRTSDSGNKY